MNKFSFTLINILLIKNPVMYIIKMMEKTIVTKIKRSS